MAAAAEDREAGAALTLQLSIGPELISHALDRRSLELREIARLSVAAPIQYVWPHPSRRILYVASSNRSISKPDDIHSLATVAVDAASGAMRIVAEVELPTRPIHLCVEPDGRRLLVAYNAPSLLTLHAIDAEGRAGAALPDARTIETGVFPHQIMVMPSGKSAILVARGNHAQAGRPEEPGSLRLLALDGDHLRPRQVVRPGGGVNYGPRHLDFHPNGRWVALSIERQNELHIHAIDGDRLSPEPVFRLSTLPADAAAALRSSHDQLAGTVRFHPDGKTLYVVNRNDTAVYGDGSQASELAGNNIAVHSFDPTSGRPELLQHAATGSVHVRTFSLDREGGLLVSASILPALTRHADGRVERLPAMLSFFRVAADGRLALAKTLPMPNQTLSLFWSRLQTLA